MTKITTRVSYLDLDAVQHVYVEQSIFEHSHFCLSLLSAGPMTHKIVLLCLCENYIALYNAEMGKYPV